MNIRRPRLSQNILLLAGSIALAVVLAAVTARSSPQRVAAIPPVMDSQPPVTRAVNLTPDPTEMAPNLAPHIYDLLYKRQGRVIAQGTNDTPVGTKGPKTYRVEEVALPGPTNVQPLTGKDQTVDKIWRVTITGGPFVGGALDWNIWLDNTLLGVGLENVEGLTTIVYDRSLLREGAIVRVGYGSRPKIELPERLHITPVP